MLSPGITMGMVGRVKGMKNILNENLLNLNNNFTPGFA